MSAELLRRAAALMRERAEAATPGPWITHEMGNVFVGNQADGRTSGLWEIVHMSGDDLRDLIPEAATRNRADAEHIASWHPAVALAVADWLEEVAAWDDEGCGRVPGIEQTNYPDAVMGSLACATTVARAYLGIEE
jgi:hypothetical protein